MWRPYHHRLSAGVLAVLLLLLVIPAQASVVTFVNDQSTWLTQTDVTQVTDFTNFNMVPGNWAFYNSSSGLLWDGLQFIGSTGTGGYFLLVSYPALGGPEDFGTGTKLRGPDYYPGSYLEVVLPANITAFGFDLMSGSPDGLGFRLLLDGIDAGIVIPTNPLPTPTFVAFQSDTPVSDVKILLNSGTLFSSFGMFDNFTLGTVHVSAPPPGDPPPGDPPPGDPGGGGSGGGGGAEPFGDPGDPPMAEAPEVTTILYVGTGIALLLIQRRKSRRIA